MFYQGLHTLYINNLQLHCISFRKDEGSSSATFVDVPTSSLNVQLPGQSANGGSLRRKRATDLSWSLTGLEEFTIYIIHVVFYTVGISPYSLPLEIQTAEDGRCGEGCGIIGKCEDGQGAGRLRVVEVGGSESDGEREAEVGVLEFEQGSQGKKGSGVMGIQLAKSWHQLLEAPTGNSL